MACKCIMELLSTDHPIATLFAKQQIDCVSNDLCTLVDIPFCRQKDVHTLVRDIHEIRTSTSFVCEEFAAFPLDSLMTFITATYHSYVLKKIPNITQQLHTLCNKYGSNQPSLFEIHKQFSKISYALSVHVKEEEHLIFPALHKLLQIKQVGIRLSHYRFGTILPPLQPLYASNEVQRTRLQKMKSLTHEYPAPKDTCHNYNVTFMALQQFETHITRYIELEKNIFLPKAESLKECLF
ncbi:hemerythrin domain-containing protein [Arenibacter sp. GZD96]|uniref:hemerythrin domain-containing protein n=1 Tax=Aurantibrevibacter litoralis TaxID=3106030 RepID=UPI002AFE0A85|nr:hemerythrin domain-containing protein [Arenibacter sp. GZD-96]MEA1784781.1 hemerythrin domain-containing protein [Arenibacter sp. GZD-96]